MTPPSGRPFAPPPAGTDERASFLPLPPPTDEEVHALPRTVRHRKRVTRLVRGQLVREMCSCLPNGWPAVLDDATRFDVAHALGAWVAFTPETHKERADQAGDALLATPPPPGWLPRGPDDELLLTLLPDEEA
jgi:hypothetical protein